MEMELSPILLSLQLALVTTGLLLGLSIPLARWLSAKKSWAASLVETLVSLPLVLPPTVIGFYLLIAFSPEGAFGKFIENTIGLRLVFSFPGLVIASLVYSLPFMVHPLLAGFRSLPAEWQEQASLFGKTHRQFFWQVQLPNLKPALLTGIVLSFAHTLGEFGVALMVGGNIPGKTRLASMAVYDELEAMNLAGAHRYALLLLGISFLILVAVYRLNAKWFSPRS